MSMQPRFFDFLRDRIGLDVASVGAAMIERAVQQRCHAAQCPDLERYWALLQGSASEQQALIEAVVVPETSFMRYPETFNALVQLARERLSAARGERVLRILSLPCSTGEEPYSIAMSLLDAGMAARSFVVDAVDISPLSVERARRGVYGRNSFRGQALEFRDRHFTPVAEGYQLHEAVRQCVRLQVGNVLDPGLLAGAPPYDFVFCRNLLIYFDLETQQRVFEVLKRFTQLDGALFIGPAEGSLLGRLGMRPVGIAQSFAFVRGAAPVLAAPAAPPVSQPPLPPRARVEAPPSSRPPPPRPVVGKPTLAVSRPAGEDPDTLLASIVRLANEGHSQEAMAACERYLQQHAPHAEVFYWLGLLNDVAGKTQEAQGFYRKALYLQPQHSEALAHLAVLLAAQGDSAGAKRLQARAQRNAQSGEQERKG
ncbi:CheR family methyltransferase [Pseudomonas sp. nanlin1]|uniref:CheR family methyltransferase n=1 Tax=Pseudomonas sp. nanlin1 TaxID=3040605 RepID=UPI0038911782